MSTHLRSLVVTTINSPNDCLRQLASGAMGAGIPFIVIGDTKTPPDFHLNGASYYSFERQREEFGQFCSVLPEKHYARKNLGYLLALQQGASEIQETDDDNRPTEGFWRPLPNLDSITEVRRHNNAWFNVYSLFSDVFIWPRGLPLEAIQTTDAPELGVASSRGMILQGLADGDPDVDAIYRLTRTLPVTFQQRAPVVLRPGTWCPFNSQNTVFQRKVFPLLYLPSFCSFRMTDIWRSFVAQRCLWELGEGVVFHSSTVFQDRNEHNLLRDFEEEVPGYLSNDKIRRCLEPLRLDGDDLPRSLRLCYEALILNGFIPEKENLILQEWCRELERAI